MAIFKSVKIGTKKGRLTSMSLPFKRKGFVGYRIICKCSCGNIKETRKIDFLSGRCKSCGCLRKEKASNSALVQRKMSAEESGLGVLYSKYKQQAKDRGLIFKLSIDFFRNITGSNCGYCGEKPNRISRSQNALNGGYTFNGIDRIDNGVGYEDGNVVPCCKECNYMKGTSSLYSFIEKCKKISENFTCE